MNRCSPFSFVQTIYLYIYTHTLRMFISRTDLKERSTLKGEVISQFRTSSIIQCYISTARFRMVKEWPHSLGNFNDANISLEVKHAFDLSYLSTSVL